MKWGQMGILLVLASSSLAMSMGTAVAGPLAQESVAPLRLLLSLAAVIGLILVLAFVLRRLPGMGTARSGELRVVGSIAVGSRERVVLVEAGGSRMLIGVAPGRVQGLYVLPMEGAKDPASAVPAGRSEPMITMMGQTP
ncbi:MAG TPA: flagellar biosynthetic protein FliO [Candidatus Macondimonas sp.]|nr:flagellar biosynthetic protein FliO [Candidatus Macondimonas sp.]